MPPVSDVQHAIATWSHPGEVHSHCIHHISSLLGWEKLPLKRSVTFSPGLSSLKSLNCKYQCKSLQGALKLEILWGYRELPSTLISALFINKQGQCAAKHLPKGFCFHWNPHYVPCIFRSLKYYLSAGFMYMTWANTGTNLIRFLLSSNFTIIFFILGAGLLVTKWGTERIS